MTVCYIAFNFPPYLKQFTILQRCSREMTLNPLSVFLVINFFGADKFEIFIWFSNLINIRNILLWDFAIILRITIH